MKVKRALISVFDKEGVVDFAKGLSALDIEILSTGGTYRLLLENGVRAIEVSSYTGFPEILSGRVKTLHPFIHGGILAVRGNRGHEEEMSKCGIRPIDMVVVNLYPFEETVKKGAGLDEVIENIDIGGPSMIRAAAKNYRHVAVVVDPSDYDHILNELKANNSELSESACFELARKAFATTARYEDAISNWFGGMLDSGKEQDIFPTDLNLSYHKMLSLRYGENPHQRAALYISPSSHPVSIAKLRQLGGKELSYNNMIDVDAALHLAYDFTSPFAAIIKHTNPCGAASSDTILDAFRMAFETDPDSAFGGIVVVNRMVDEELARIVSSHFFEIVIAPEFSDSAVTLLKNRKNLRILALPELDRSLHPAPTDQDQGLYDLDIRGILGGILIQDRDEGDLDIRKCSVPTRRRPTDEEYESLSFAWKIVKHVKSNAIVYASGTRLLGVGAGQMSRIDAARIAAMKARTPLHGSALASDAFFPFRDVVDEAASRGATAIIQPGGSIRDEESIKAADEHGIAMVFTGRRHFKH